jgi:hypothetical protein
MVKCQEECMSLPEPRKAGLFGALRALKSPDVQRALAFLVNLGRYFGESIDTRHAAATGRERVPGRPPFGNGLPPSTTS